MSIVWDLNLNPSWMLGPWLDDEPCGHVLFDQLWGLIQTCGEETASHLDRVESYTRLLATQLCRSGQFPELSPFRAELIARASPWHDLGKIHLPHEILFKPNQLNPQERAIVQTHVHHGRRIVESYIKRSPDSLFLQLTREIVLTHHERYDGSGYPNGLKGREIPLSGRLVALVDVYDALTSKRVYKSAMTHEETMVWLTKDNPHEFDPKLLEGLILCANRFQVIGKRLREA